MFLFVKGNYGKVFRGRYRDANEIDQDVAVKVGKLLHHLFAQYAEMNSKICNVPDRKANSFSSNNCP